MNRGRELQLGSGLARAGLYNGEYGAPTSLSAVREHPAHCRSNNAGKVAGDPHAGMRALQDACAPT